MADRITLGMIGLMFGIVTLFVTMAGAMVVGDHLTGRLHIDDNLTAAVLPANAR